MVDSCGWIEFFGGGALADRYEPYVTRASRKTHYTSAIVIYEVFKRMSRTGEREALEACGSIVSSTNVVPVDEKVALLAADLSMKHGLSVADAIIKATADLCGAKIVTSDEHLGKLKGVQLIV
ncbi:MAG: type II toxin-antitoxin system VapC family toxin [Methanobacteriota archaeon]